MKIVLTLEITVDPQVWALTYGTGPEESDVRPDVISYTTGSVAQSAAASEGAITMVVVR